MPQVKISQLSPLTAPARNDLIPLVDTSANTTKYIQMMYALTGATRIVAPVGYQGYADYYTDGIADEVEINAAITAVNGAGGGVLKLKSGNYTSAAPIVMLSNVNLEGEGYTTFITSANTANINLLTATGQTNLKIRQLKIDANRTHHSGITHDAIKFDAVTSSLISNCYITSSIRYGIWFSNVSTHNEVSSNIVTDCGGNILDTSGLNDIHDNQLTSAYISHGISVQTLSGGAAANGTLIRGNYIASNTVNGISIGGSGNVPRVAGLGSSNNVITGNYIINHTASNNIALNFDANYNVISNNYCGYSGYSGIIIWGNYNTVSLNIIWNSASINSAFAILADQQSVHTIIIGNICGADSGIGYFGGIGVTVDADYVTIEGNDVNDSQHTTGVTLNTTGTNITQASNIGSTTNKFIGNFTSILGDKGIAQFNDGSNASAVWGQNIGLISQASQAQFVTRGTLPFVWKTGGSVNTMSNSSTEKMRLDTNGNLGIGVTAPTAVLHLKAGTAAAETGSLKFTPGTNLTTPEDGAMEYDGAHLYFTIGSTRTQIL